MIGIFLLLCIFPLVQPLVVQEYEGVLAPLANYFNAVNLPVQNLQQRETKLDAIVSTFSLTSHIVDQYGHYWVGHEGVRGYYSRPQSPVCVPGFQAYPHNETAATNGVTISVEIELTNPEQVSRVGDFFSMESNGLIHRLAVYEAKEEQPLLTKPFFANSEKRRK
jgi:hypothetical protein